MELKLSQISRRVTREVRRLIQRASGQAQPLTLRLSGSEVAKLQNLARIRGESVSKAAPRIVSNFLEGVPGKLKARNVLRSLDFVSVKLVGGLVELQLSNGRVFYSYPSRSKYANLYWAIKDIVPAGFSAETYQAGIDVAARYLHRESRKYFPLRRGDVVIEGGAFIGYKSIKLAETVGPRGKVFAIEIGQRNYELLCKNVQANSLSHVITPIHCGVWNAKGHMNAAFEHANWYHLASADEHDKLSRQEVVPTDTLDNIIDGLNIERVNMLILQLNGSEHEAIEGLDRRLNDVMFIRAAAYYTRNGVPQRQAVRELLERKGCTVICESAQGLLTAATAACEHAYPPWPADKALAQTKV